MDHVRPNSNARLIKRIALISALSLAVIGGGVAITSIDFSSQRVDRDKLSIETVQRGTLEIKVEHCKET